MHEGGREGVIGSLKGPRADLFTAHSYPWLSPVQACSCRPGMFERQPHGQLG